MDIQIIINGQQSTINLSEEQAKSVYDEIATKLQCDDLKFKLKMLIEDNLLPHMSDESMEAVIKIAQPLFNDALDGSMNYRDSYFEPAKELLENTYIQLKTEGLIME